MAQDRLVDHAALEPEHPALARSGGPWAASAGAVTRAMRAGRPSTVVLRAWSTGDDDRRLVADALAIATGIGIGFITYAVLKLAAGRAREVSGAVWLIAALCVVKFTVT